jgi:hypothetical protein
MESRVALFSSNNSALHILGWSLVLVLLAACSNPVAPAPAQKVPFDLQAVLPKDWAPIGSLREINIDGDADTEWLLLFRYNAVKAGYKMVGPIGGVIFDPQKTGPSATVVLKPYLLLPDLGTGKGQGYLGERDIQLKTYDIVDESGNKATELAVFGYGAETLFPTQLTIFRWDKAQQLYQTIEPSPFIGNGGIDVDAPADKPGPIMRVGVKQRTNDRSLLSESVVYRRQGQSYQEQKNEYGLDFTYGIPDNPFYPEATVLAYQQWMNKGQWDKAQSLLLSDQDRQQLQSTSVTAESASLINELTSSGQSVPSYNGPVFVKTLAYDPQSQEIHSQAAPGFLYNTTMVTVTARVFSEGVPSTQTWQLINAQTGSCKGTVCWRIIGQQ